MITDESSNITHQYRYDDFGTITRWSEPNNNNNPFKYVGIYGVEYETNDLYYMRARYYKPSIGRFLTEDPIWSTNLYPYADNNPIIKIDPKGEKSFFSNKWLSDKFYNNGYGDAVNLISQESTAWDFALNNPEISGLIVGFGVATGASSLINGAIYGASAISGAGTVGSQYLIATSVKSIYWTYTSANRGNLGKKVFTCLGRIEDNSYRSFEGVFDKINK